MSPYQSLYALLNFELQHPILTKYLELNTTIGFEGFTYFGMFWIRFGSFWKASVYLCVPICISQAFYGKCKSKCYASNFMKSYVQLTQLGVYQFLVETTKQETMWSCFFQNFWDTQTSGSTSWNRAKIFIQDAYCKKKWLNLPAFSTLRGFPTQYFQEFLL